MRGRLDVREIEDIGDSALSYNEVKALAAGNPLLLDHAQAHAELTRLERLETSYYRGLDTLRLTIGTAAGAVSAMQARVAAADAAIARRTDVRGDRFAATIGQRTYGTRADATHALRGTLVDLMADPRIPRGSSRIFGRIAGFDIQATLYRDINRHPSIQLELLDVPLSAMTLGPTEVQQQDLLTRLANRLTDLETVKAKALAEIDGRNHDIATAQEQLDTPFRYTNALREARERFADLDALLTEQASPRPDRRETAHNGAADRALGADPDRTGEAGATPPSAAHTAFAPPHIDGDLASLTARDRVPTGARPTAEPRR
jgi:hypothetical protein